MNISLYLTRRCNLKCKYCFECHSDLVMSEETALNAIKLAADMSENYCGISFFGGEPLLQKPLIKKCVEYAESISDIRFDYNMTTNGLLLDDGFLDFAVEHGIDIAFSHDGLMSRVNRLYPNGEHCLAQLDSRLEMLLKRKPTTFIMATLSPNTVDMMSESMIYLYERGAKAVNLAIDLRPEAGWEDEHLECLAEQFQKLSDYLLQAFSDGRCIVFNNYNEKIKQLTADKPKHKCELGMRKLSVDSDGIIYPCIQFVGKREFAIGDVKHGVDMAKQKEIYSRSLIKPRVCEGCALENRCVNDCSCVNYQQCGDMSEISPLQCEYQRILINAADSLAQRMMQADEQKFIERYLRVKSMREFDL